MRKSVYIWDENFNKWITVTVEGPAGTMLCNNANSESILQIDNDESCSNSYTIEIDLRKSGQIHITVFADAGEIILAEYITILERIIRW